ncbi:MAG: hypothetical protein IT184_10990 [Acidobacteria bacterium]|nr:hypothetical protein [Acidobacteriota bacterium]
MTSRRAAFVRALLALACLGVASGVLYARETRHPLPQSTARLMYLTSGAVADRLYLSFDAIAADLYWIRTIQHYGRDRKSARTTDRFQFLQPLLDLTTRLDPHFNIAYRFGAIFLSMAPPNGPGRPDQAVQLLEKGMAANPQRWQYAHDVGFIHYWYRRDYESAGRWFRKAAALPGAPDWLEPLAALTLAQGGDRAGARRLFHELRTSEERYIRSAAERSLAQLDALDVIDRLQADVDRYTRDAGRPPHEWQDLVRTGRIPGIPLDPTGMPFVYDETTGAVSLSPQSSLSPLPQALAR